MRKLNFSNLPSLNALRAFESAGRLSSFTLAAKELNVTQGAISRQIRQLEAELEIILFHRYHRSITLTDRGVMLLESLTAAFDMMETVVKEVKKQQQDLSIKVHPTFAIRWLIPRLHKFQAACPDIQTQFTIVGINVDFSKENFDAGITHNEEERPGICREKILEERLIPVCSPELLVGNAPLNKIDDLKHHVLLHNNPDQREWQIWASQMGINLGSERSQLFEVDDAAIRAATAGLGVALGDLFLIKEELLSGQLVTPFGHIFAETGSYYFSYPQRNNKSQEIKAFQHWLINEIDHTLSKESTRARPPAAP